MEWIQVFTIILSLAGLLYWFKQSLEKDISRLDTDMKGLNARMDADREAFTVRMDADRHAQAARTDQLYQMFIDLLKQQQSKPNS